MQQKDIVSGFSDLKDILIRTYKIERPRNQIRLHFTFSNEELWMHDYDDHWKKVVVAKDGRNRVPENSRGWKLIRTAIKYKNPHTLLNELFQSHGFFRL